METLAPGTIEIRVMTRIQMNLLARLTRRKFKNGNLRRDAKRNELPLSHLAFSRSARPHTGIRNRETRDSVVVVVIVIAAHSDKEINHEVETREKRTDATAYLLAVTYRRRCFTHAPLFSQGHPIILQDKEQGVVALDVAPVLTQITS